MRKDCGEEEDAAMLLLGGTPCCMAKPWDKRPVKGRPSRPRTIGQLHGRRKWVVGCEGGWLGLHS